MDFEDFSKVSYWMSLGAILTVLFDLGINQYLQVNYAGNIKKLAESLLGLKVILGFVITAILGLFVHETPLFFFLTSYLFVSFQAFFSYYLRLQQKFFFDVVFNLFYYALFVLLFVYLLSTDYWQPALLFAWFHFITRLVLLLLVFGLLVFVFKQRIQVLSLLREREQLKKILGFSFLSVLFVSMQNVDSLILYKTIESPALFSKLSMVIKIGFLNFAFFDAFITFVSAMEAKEGRQGPEVVTKQLKQCLLFGIFIAFGIHIMAFLLPFVVGEKWKGIADMSAWAIVNNISLYVLLFFQFKLLAAGKVRPVAWGIVGLIAGSSLISYFFVSYQLYFLLNAVLKLIAASCFIIVYWKKNQLQLNWRLQLSKA